VHVLILTQYYTPEPVPRPAELARGLADRGIRVSVLTGFPNYPSGDLYEGYRQQLVQREVVDGIPVTRIPLFADHSKNALLRALNLLSFAATASLLGPLVTDDIDVVFVFAGGLPMGIPAWVIGALKNVPFVFAIHDIWPETLVATGMLKNPLALRALSILEQFVYRKSAAIGLLTNGFRDNLVRKGVRTDKLNVISNWVDGKTYRVVPPDSTLAERTGMAGHFNVMFAGNMGFAQGLQTVIEAADLTRDVAGLQYVMVGDGIEKQRLEEEVAKRGLTNVRFLGRWPAEDMSALYAIADVLLCHLRRDPIYLLTVPSKTYTYLACGRPVLMAVGGEGRDLIDQTGSGLSCPSEDAQAMADVVRRFAAMTVEQRNAYGAAARRAYEELFRQEMLIGRYVKLFEDVIARRRSSRAS
jgi:colanic acid biosynthesis glycosyl transferase WcaI